MAKLIGWLACTSAVLLLVVAMVSGVVGSAVGAATTGGTAADARITGAWVRLPAVPGRPAAGYFTLRGGAHPAELVSISSPLARIEMHSMSMAGGVMRMDRLPAIRVAALAAVSFAPGGGGHLMLFDLSPTLKPGTTVPLTFKFADGATVKVDAATRSAGAAAPTAETVPMTTGE